MKCVPHLPKRLTAVEKCQQECQQTSARMAGVVGKFVQDKEREIAVYFLTEFVA
jgi:hypothetical protein